MSDTSSIRTVAEVSSRTISNAIKDPDKNPVEFHQYPEGGTAAWCAVLGGVFAQFCAFGYTTSFGVYQDFYTLYYLTNKSTSAISWIGSVDAFLVCLSGPVAGTLYDRGYFYHMVIGGSLLQSFSLFMLSLAKPGQYYQVFLAQGVGLGLGQGFVYLPTMAVASHYFFRRRTLAMSLVACGSSIGSIVNPIMLNYLFNRNVGFANGVRISATLISVLLLSACLLIRTRLETPKRPTNYLSVAKRSIYDVPFCLTGIGFMFFFFGFYYPLFYLQLDSAQHGNPGTFSFYTLVIMNGASLVGRLTAPLIATYVSVPKLVITATAACSVLILSMIGLNDVVSVVVIGAIYGYFSGIYIALYAPLMAFLTDDTSELGARMGIGTMFAGVGALLGGPISGALLTSQYKWWQPSLFSGLIALTGCFFFVMSQVTLIWRQGKSLEKQAADDEA